MSVCGRVRNIFVFTRDYMIRICVGGAIDFIKLRKKKQTKQVRKCKEIIINLITVLNIIIINFEYNIM
jgi:hypothetical protein